MKRLYYILTALSVILTVFSFQACFDEDMSDCPSGIEIYFDFTRGTYASAKEGINPDDVTHLHLFVFDTAGVLVNEYVREDVVFNEEYCIKIDDLLNGEYDMVAWGGLKDDFTLVGDLIPGETTKDNLQVLLNCINKNDQTVTKQISKLFFADKATPVTVVNGLDIKDKLALIQDTYKMNITVQGLNIKDEEYQLSIEDNNGLLNFNNSIASSGMFNYKTVCEPGVNNLKGSLSTLRLMNGRAPMLRLTRESSNEPLFERNLVEMILLIQTLGGVVDFSYMHEFDIELTANPSLEFTVTINGWTVIKADTDLEI